MQRCAERIIANFPILPPYRQRSIHYHANPHSSPRHRPQSEHRQHQKHRPHHQIDNHVILRILYTRQIPATVGIAVVEHIQKPAIKPPRQFPPEGEEEQCELHKRRRHHCLHIPHRTERYQWNTDHQRHLQQRPPVPSVVSDARSRMPGTPLCCRVYFRRWMPAG